ncbi:Mu-like prophage major head subunit gpT [Actinobacillus pleuropneumoniae]|uniref:Bacteriophage mu T protein n=1 Tax=Actinobacillus minor NM305 TaxID=637911 RepID=C5S002_9PAST|nr:MULTISPECIES: Mu-like prophage major head subunit gpT family protein [Actinobacillus]EER47740.1 bacteriophage mu T protein [Actinobacillus minor NM305]EFM88685.1 Bacteriophage mu T-like protein [Actinobacillus pleuropneumoniae serovar 4 str. M62]UKH42062.1 head protein [Actinobacillus pleuropneumoniae serovar 4 str. M62]SQF65656.1 Mu-like prophage major head subunit gpT [Actinobacillus pleuropneumoniae]
MFKKSELLKALDTAFRKEFSAGLKVLEPQWGTVAMKVSSSTATNTYAWLGQFPKMQEWVGDRQIKNMQAQGMTIENKLFESTVAVPRTAIEDDQVGLFTPMVKQAAQSAAELPDDLVFSLLKKGKTTLCYDGQNFFDTDHPVYQNVDGTGTSKTQSNITTGSASGKPAFYVLDDSQAIKPLIWQERTTPEIETKFDPSESDHVFMKDQYLWGVRSRGNAGFGFWQLIHRVEDSELNSETLEKVLTAMRTLKGDGDKQLNIRPTTLLVPPSLEFAARKLLEAELINGTTNTLKGVLKVVVNPFITE